MTPFSPTDWKMTYDGESVSLWPSIGNWNLACRTHYIIKRDLITEAGPWSEKRIAAERIRGKAAKAAHYRVPGREPALTAAPASPVAIATPDPKPPNALASLWRWLRDRF